MSRSLEDALFGVPSPRARAVTRAASVAAAEEYRSVSWADSEIWLIDTVSCSTAAAIAEAESAWR